ncbi:hypothetical protein LshimejAT787_0802330 [Lyophyllum shimeji]|uniref:Uncharacterized protein n=1 Tax=Lyophyllum shimeji TaxID=47721 RepID=A0A9P3UPJ2_LYOSH|nr:hypothetical protein LshimejAT787_0802330 [Lyophyllum shimeji]
MVEADHVSERTGFWISSHRFFFGQCDWLAHRFQKTRSVGHLHRLWSEPGKLSSSLAVYLCDSGGISLSIQFAQGKH